MKAEGQKFQILRKEEKTITDPLSAEEVQAMYDAGEIGAGTLVYTPKSLSWLPLARYAGFQMPDALNRYPRYHLFSALCSGLIYRPFLFRGRACRAEWVWLTCSIVFVAWVVTFAAFYMGYTIGVDSFCGLDVVAGIMLVPWLAACARRLNDTQRSLFHLLWLFVPYLGWLILLRFLLGKSRESNPNGSAPLPPFA